MRKPIRRFKRRIQKPKDCFFCKQKLIPDYKDVDTIKKFISERGKILGRQYNGLCQKHQRQLSSAVKRARIMALLPFIVRPS